jgi:hypothetical protein
VNNSGEAPSPYFTPKLARNLRNSPELLSKHNPYDATYMFLIIYTSSAGMSRHATNTFHNFSRFILSYARCRSIKHSPSGFFDLILCCTKVYNISTYSIVPWCARNPAWVGAWRFLHSASFVKRLFITAMNSLDMGGATAMLR